MRLLRKLSHGLAVTIVVAAPLLGTTIFAVPTPSFTYYPLPTADASPSYIALGPDGAMWFTENTAHKIGRVSPTGQVTEYALPNPNSFPQDITAGPDGAMWFTEDIGNRIGRISMTGEITEFDLPKASSLPKSITTGPDGAMWFTEFNNYRIGRLTTSGQLNEYQAIGINYWITTGADQGIWSNDLPGSRIIRYGLDGVDTARYQATPDSTPLRLASGPDGAMWFTEGFSTNNPAAGNNVGRMTTDGQYSEFPMPLDTGLPAGITSGPDAALWVTWNDELYGGKIYKLTTSGEFTDYTSGQVFAGLLGITPDNAGNLWFVDRMHNAIVKMNPAATPPAPEAANLALSPQSAVNNVDTTANFTATATDKNSAPVADATVRFKVTGSDTRTGSCTTDATGHCSYGFNGPNLPGADSIDAYVDTNENAQLDLNEPSARATQAWTLPQITAGQAAGGGHVANIDSTQGIAFGFTAKSTGATVNGNCQLVDPNANIDLHCSTLTSMTVSGTHASIFGTATLNKTLSTTYRIDIVDNGEPGTGDSFELYTDSGYSAKGTLLNGNIQIKP
jgi:virginiamycin B lyase